MILRFLHGWGFDRTLWHEVIAHLPQFDCRCDDRGYFGREIKVTDGEVAVAHSFGTMRLLADPPPRLQGVIAINGFDCFTARDGFPGVPARVVERMLARFEGAPGQILAEFRRRCGADDGPAEIELAPLRADLVALREQDCRDGQPFPILALQAADDPIVPAAMQAAVFAANPGTTRMTAPTGGHLLPLSDPARCAQAIRALVEQTA